MSRAKYQGWNLEDTNIQGANKRREAHKGAWNGKSPRNKKNSREIWYIFIREDISDLSVASWEFSM